MLNSQSITAVALDTIGANGLDSQSAPTALNNTWFTKADNIAYTEGGKVSFRKGAKQRTTSIDATIGSLVEYKDAISTKLFVSHGGSISRLELTEKDDAFKSTYSPADVVTSDWSWINFNNKLIGVQGQYARPVVFDGTNWNYLEDNINDSTAIEVSSGSFVIGTRYKIKVLGAADWSSVGGSDEASVGDFFTATSDGTLIDDDGVASAGGTFPEGVDNFNPSCCSGQFGRMWAGGIEEEKDVLYWSALLDESQWWTSTSTTDAGFLDLKTVWGKDEIVAIHSFGGKLVIFGKDNIALYDNPAELVKLTLDEVIKGIGCITRDSIQAVADDLLFLSETGVRSLTRTAEFDKLPLKEISITVKNEIISNIKSSRNVKSVYMANEGLYLLTFVDTKVTYVFDLTYTTERDTPRVTKWSWENDRTPTALAYSELYGLLLGQKSGKVATYEGYWDIDYTKAALVNGVSVPSFYSYFNYTGGISTVWIDLGQGVTASILKKLILVVGGGQSTDITIKAYKDFSISPIINTAFTANPALTGIPYQWSNVVTQSDMDNVAELLHSTILRIIVSLENGGVLYDLLNEDVTVGDTTSPRGAIGNASIGPGSAGDFSRYYTSISNPGDDDYDWIQEHVIDYMLDDLDTYGVYFGATPADITPLFGCNTSYDYGATGFCSTDTYTGTNSDMRYRTQVVCEAETDHVWNETTDTTEIDQPVNCAAAPAKFAPLAGFVERPLPLSSTAKYLRIEMEGITQGYEASLQSLSLLYKQGKTL